MRTSRRPVHIVLPQRPREGLRKMSQFNSLVASGGTFKLFGQTGFPQIHSVGGRVKHQRRQVKAVTNATQDLRGH